VRRVTERIGGSAQTDISSSNRLKGNPMKKRIAVVVLAIAALVAVNAPAAMAALQQSSRASGF
jgi:hypothetical protein